MRSLNLLREHSAALQGLAATLVIVGTLLSGALWLYKKAFSSELLVRVELDRSTIPPDLLGTMRDLLRQVGAVQRYVKLDGNSTFVKDLFGTMSRDTSNRARNYVTDDIQRLLVSIDNRSDRTISDVRLRLLEIHSLWSSRIEGSYLTGDEALAYQSKMGGINGSEFVLPQLPSLPPKSTLTLIFWGSFTDYEGKNNVELTAQGASWSVTRLQNVESGLGLSIFLFMRAHPYLMTWILLWVMVFILQTCRLVIRPRTVKT